MSPQLEQCLERLKKLCSHVETSSAVAFDKFCVYFSPLTFFYVMADLIRREGLSASTLDFHPPSFFCTSLEAFQAWMGGSPVWRVKVRCSFGADEKIAYEEKLRKFGSVVLRLILLPNNKAMVARADPQKVLELLTAPDCHYIDNLEFKLNADGVMVDRVEISFLLANRNLLKTHSGIVADHKHRMLLFRIGRFGIDHEWEVGSLPEARPVGPWRKIEFGSTRCIKEIHRH